MRTILLLTEEEKNVSVQLIKQALILECSHAKTRLKVIVMEKKADDTVMFDATKQAIVSHSGGVSTTLLRLNDIALIMVRTWSEQRDPVLDLCEALRARGAPVLDAELMPWTHSKIAQYRSLQSVSVFQKSFCLDENWMHQHSLMTDGDALHASIQQVLIDVEALGFPLVIKTSRGSRGTGVYRVNNTSGLTQFIVDYLSNTLQTPPQIKRHGLLIQQFIPPVASSMERSTYFRLNIVNQIICSVVQFELGWSPIVLNGTYRPYDKINDSIHDAVDKPIDLDAKLNAWYENILPLLPWPLGVVGLDVMRDEQGKYFLLEVNCGPAVALIESLGARYSGTESGAQCQNFSTQIAAFTVQKALKYTQSIAALKIQGFFIAYQPKKQEVLQPFLSDNLPSQLL